jgi:hypothetical protein
VYKDNASAVSTWRRLITYELVSLVLEASDISVNIVGSKTQVVDPAASLL